MSAKKYDPNVTRRYASLTLPSMFRLRYLISSLSRLSSASNRALRASKARNWNVSQFSRSGCLFIMSTRDLIETAERSLFLTKREGRTSADTLINGLGHAIPRDPFEKLRTIDLARFRNEGCILTTSLSPCTECSNNASAVSVCPLTPRRRERKRDQRRVPWANTLTVRRGRRQGKAVRCTGG